jgi:alpha-tubulin suppressor-like RCC1 family protein
LRHTLAIKTDGTLWSWGFNTNGQLGLGNTTNYSSPKQVGALTTWNKVAAGFFSLAIKTDGTLWSWGFNTFGQLGLGNTTDYSSPKQVGALTTWSQIASSTHFSLVVKTDGTLWAWGRNNAGQLGIGTSGGGTYQSSPVQVGALTTWSKTAAAGDQALAIKTDGKLWSWGANTTGQLGLGNTTSYSSPKQVGTLTTWSEVSGGATFSLALIT